MLEYSYYKNEPPNRLFQRTNILLIKILQTKIKLWHRD